jgi:hypothetical protein
MCLRRILPLLTQSAVLQKALFIYLSNVFLSQSYLFLLVLVLQSELLANFLPPRG